MSPVTILQNIVDASVLINGLQKHLERWIPTYLAEIDEQRGLSERGFTEIPRSFQIVPKFDNPLQDQLPAMLIVCPGNKEPPTKRGDGSFEGTYGVGIAALVKGQDQVNAQEIAKRYGGAITTAIMQRKGLQMKPEIIEDIVPRGESFTDISSGDSRTLASVTVHFDVTLKGIFNERGGPKAPILGEPYENPKQNPTEPYTGWGKIPDEEHISVTLVKKK